MSVLSASNTQLHPDKNRDDPDAEEKVSQGSNVPPRPH